MTSKADGVLTLSRIKVINANAISGPFSWGFPAITAFCGFAHALGRSLRRDENFDLDFRLGGVAVICHQFEVQASGTFERRLHLTRNPLTGKGKTPAFVEEGRVDIEISLVLEIESIDIYEIDDQALQFVCRQVESLMQSMRLAGGSIAPETVHDAASIDVLYEQHDDHAKWWRSHRRKLLPGFALVGAHDSLVAHLEYMREKVPDSDELDAFMDFTALHWGCRETEDGGEWSVRSRAGWFVPLPVGYSAISPLYEPGQVGGARDTTVPFRFVETAYSIGRWVSPHRVDLKDLFWSHCYDPDAEVYLCINHCSKETI